MSETYKNSTRIPMPGDWVRFYLAGELIIACVQYITREGRGYPFEKQLHTDRGTVNISDVLEVR